MRIHINTINGFAGGQAAFYAWWEEIIHLKGFHSLNSFKARIKLQIKKLSTHVFVH